MERLISRSRTVLLFALVGGLLGEAAELALLARGGIVPPGLRVRLTLFAVYGTAAILSYAAAVVVTRVGGRRLALAAGLFGALLLLPLLNFDYLPQLVTWRTLVGNLVALAFLAGAVWGAGRFPWIATAIGITFVVAANVGRLGVRGVPQGEGGQREGGATPLQFNVVLLVIDTLRADHLGTYGYPRPTSPHIDRLADSSTVFEQAVSQATYTKPSVASLLTGAFVHRHGVIASRDALGAEFPTLAERLRAHGYSTAAFSSNPWITPEFRFQRGFDYFESNRAIDVQLTVLYRLLRRVGATVKQRGGGDFTKWLLRASGEPNPSNSRRDEILTASAIRWLEAHHDRPFFLYAHLIGPHDPYDPPAEAVKPFRNSAWDGTAAPVRPPERVLSAFETARSLEPVARDMMVAQYDGAIAFADTLVGRIASALERLSLLDRTLLIITADHGEEFYEHGNWGHGVRLYQEIVRVPLLFRLPAVLQPGRRADPAMLVDVFPTICGVLGLSCDMAQLNGRNLFAAPGATPPVAFSEYFSVEGGSYASRMVLRDGLKLIVTRDSARGQVRSELFDIRTDPGEHRNMVTTPSSQSADDLAALERVLAGFGVTMLQRQAPAVDVNGATEEALRALGYGTLDRH